ncbi:uncharacterized protein LTHEOB_2987 [Lasiodiplodia theobromae]|uniref:uncharacterized protein n=1 Tax=Lasiodiplodia theobromae TaxID=45133 RepID=UPI0015C398AA|nr:uncharacterized protein LTHEOB_2987 [Lasiodiplodia theobromae]KAF4535012.1 hypothetical protein LTHEOB_2987 [Lasiodiplodia theobromae]
MRLRHPETGLWLLEDDDFVAWIDGRSPKLWLTGIPGAGKTVIASVIIEEAWKHVQIGKIAVAYFYCDYKEKNSQDPTKILGSIATQLAQQSLEAFELLRNLYKECHPTSRMPRSPEASMLVTAVQKMCGFFDDVYLIVDGLDECGDHTREVTSLLRQTDQLTKSGKRVKVSLLSRSEEVIRQQLETDFVHVQIAARSEDLRLYVAAEMENRIIDGRLDLSSASLKDEILKALVEGADGMFRWVACQMDYLSEQTNEYDMRSALKSLPPSLDASYHRILETINTRSAQIQTLVQRTLRWLIYTQDILGETELRVAVSISEDMTQDDPTRQPTIRAIMTHCSSLVRRSSDTARLELAHFTVKEFLTTEAKLDIPDLAPYIFTKKASMLELAKVCVTYATFPEFDHPLFGDYDQWLAWIDQYPFRRFAIEHLVEYAEEQWSDPFIFGKMKQLFGPPNNMHFLRFAQDYMLLELAYAYPRTDRRFQQILRASRAVKELYLAVSFENAPLCNWLIEGGCSVNDVSFLGSPLHWVLLQEQTVEFRVWRELANNPDNPILRINSRTLDVLSTIVKAGANGKCCFVDADITEHSLLALVRNPYQEKSRVNEVVRLLLLAGAQADEEFLEIMDEAKLVNVNSTTPERGETALHVAVEQGSSSSARHLLDYGAEIQTIGMLRDAPSTTSQQDKAILTSFAYY